MIAGVSTSCFYPMQTHEALIELGKQGVKTAEIFISTFSELTAESVKKLQSITNHYGMKVSSIHPFTSPFESLLFFSEYQTRITDGIDLYKRYADVANGLGASIVVFHGSMNRFPVEEGLYFERYGLLAESLMEMGVQLCQENVSTCQSALPEFIEKMNQHVKDPKYVIDVKQCVRAGVDPYHMLKIMGKNVEHVHISDNAPESPCMLVGKGTFDVGKFLSTVECITPEACAILELYRENFKKPEEIGENYRKLRKLCM